MIPFVDHAIQSRLAEIYLKIISLGIQENM